MATRNGALPPGRESVVRKDASAVGAGVAASDSGGIWDSPPTGSRARERRVSVADPDKADVWLTAPSVDAPADAEVAPPIGPRAVAPVANPVDVIDVVELVDEVEDVEVVEVVEVV